MNSQEVEGENFSDTWVIYRLIVCSALGYRATYTGGFESSLLGLTHEINDLGV
jgi:hypothetical protein